MKRFLVTKVLSSKLGKVLAVAALCVLLAACRTTVSPTSVSPAGAGQRHFTEIEEQYIAAGIFETGLTAEMPQNAICPEITLGFASRYFRSGKLMKEDRHGSFHAGVDWALPEGTPIVAIADGRVVARRADGPDSTPGNHLIIKHYAGMDDISSSYTHLSRFNVDKNEEVKQGQVVGFLGDTGKGTTYPHLHLNIYGKEKIKIGKRTWRYRYDYLQFLSGDMTPIDPDKKRHQKVKVAYKDQFGKVHPPGAKVIWPFVCQRKAN